MRRELRVMQVKSADGHEENLPLVIQRRGGLHQPCHHLELTAQRRCREDGQDG